MYFVNLKTQQTPNFSAIKTSVYLPAFNTSHILNIIANILCNKCMLSLTDLCKQTDSTQHLYQIMVFLSCVLLKLSDLAITNFYFALLHFFSLFSAVFFFSFSQSLQIFPLMLLAWPSAKGNWHGCQFLILPKTEYQRPHTARKKKFTKSTSCRETPRVFFCCSFLPRLIKIL